MIVNNFWNRFNSRKYWLSNFNEINVLDFTLNNFKARSQILLLVSNRYQWLENLDITPNFVSKSDTMPSLHSEISRVFAFSLWSCQIHSPNIVGIGLNLMSHLNGLSLQIITTGLNKIKILGPSKLTIVTNSPLFCENLTRSNLVLVTEVFFYKSTLIPYRLFFSRLVKLLF